MTLYPHMELGIIPYISFEEYKKKLKNKLTTAQENIDDKTILTEMNLVVEKYEKKQKKVGGKIGNI